MFGSNLKSLRKQKGLSQTDISKELYVVRQTVSKWENDLSSPSAEQLFRLSEVLNVSTDRLSRTNEDLAATPKEEMIITITNRLNKMNETGVKELFDMIMLFPDKERWMASTSLERIAELDAVKAQHEREEKLEKEKEAREAQRIADEKRNQIYLEHERMFRAIKSIHVPTRYDLCVGEIWAIDYVCGEIRRCFPEYVYSVAGMYFNYGFVKGMRYAKAVFKRKQKKS